MTAKDVLKKAGITPGDWSNPHLNKNGCRCGYIFNPGEAVVCKIEFNDPKYENYERLSEDVMLEEAQSNGRLIAAAPKLAEALIELVEAVYLDDNDLIVKADNAEKLLESALGLTWEEMQA